MKTLNADGLSFMRRALLMCKRNPYLPVMVVSGALIAYLVLDIVRMAWGFK